MPFRYQLLVLVVVLTCTASVHGENGWKKHVVYEGSSVTTAVAGDFTGDGSGGHHH